MTSDAPVIQCGTRQVIRPNIAGRSMVKFGACRPLRWGNYFWFEGHRGGPPIRYLNFWAVNLKAARQRFLQRRFLRTRVEVILFGDGARQWAIIDDRRIPPDWSY